MFSNSNSLPDYYPPKAVLDYYQQQIEKEEEEEEERKRQLENKGVVDIKKQVYIDDLRDIKELNGFTFSGYSKTSGRTQLYKQMTRGNYESVCYWGAELMSAGHWEDIWEISVLYMSLHIYTGNTILPIYLQHRYQHIQSYLSSLPEKTLEFRNDLAFRQLMAEISIVPMLSTEKTEIHLIKLKRKEDLRLERIITLTEAPHNQYAESILYTDDPIEIVIPINEFLYQLEKKNRHRACFWIEWILEFEILCKTSKNPIRIAPRNNYVSEIAYTQDLVWLLWDALFYFLKQQPQQTKNRSTQFQSLQTATTPPTESIDLLSSLIETDESTNNNNTITNNTATTTTTTTKETNESSELKKKILQALLFCYSVHYNKSSAKRRKPILYFAVYLVTEGEIQKTELAQNTTILSLIQQQLYKIYDQMISTTTNQIPPSNYIGNRQEIVFDLDYIE